MLVLLAYYHCSIFCLQVAPQSLGKQACQLSDPEACQGVILVHCMSPSTLWFLLLFFGSQNSGLFSDHMYEHVQIRKPIRKMLLVS